MSITEISITLGRDNVPETDREWFESAVLDAVSEAYPSARVSVDWDVQQDIDTDENDPDINRAIENMLEDVWNKGEPE